MGCYHWKSDYDASLCDYCELEKKNAQERAEVVETLTRERDAAQQNVTALITALVASGDMLRLLGQALMSQFPGEDAAIAQLQQGNSLVEKSIVLRHTHEKLLASLR